MKSLQIKHSVLLHRTSLFYFILISANNTTAERVMDYGMVECYVTY